MHQRGRGRPNSQEELKRAGVEKHRFIPENFYCTACGRDVGQRRAAYKHVQVHHPRELAAPAEARRRHRPVLARGEDDASPPRVRLRVEESFGTRNEGGGVAPPPREPLVLICGRASTRPPGS